MTVAVVLAALLFWAAVFMIFFTSQGTTPGEFFFGSYETVSPHLLSWRQTGVHEATGQVREERLVLPGDNPRARRLLHQVRYRDPTTGEIVRVEPERLVRRQRVSAR